MKLHMLLFISIGLTNFAHAAKKPVCRPLSKIEKILVEDVGVMGLASHDLFAWNRKKKENRENGRLDLSTLFDSAKKGNLNTSSDFWKNSRINQGGNRKNSENAPVYTVTQQLISQYHELLAREQSPSAHSFNRIRKQMVQNWHARVETSFTRITGLDWPEAQEGTVNNQEQAAMRILHDILPGRIFRSNGEEFCVTEAKTAKTILDDQELSKKISLYDGRYDPEYQDIEIPLFLFFKLHLNLEAIDATFIQEAGLDPLKSKEELVRVGQGELGMDKTSFGKYLLSLFAKAQSSINQDGTLNRWIQP